MLLVSSVDKSEFMAIERTRRLEERTFNRRCLLPKEEFSKDVVEEQRERTRDDLGLANQPSAYDVDRLEAKACRDSTSSLAQEIGGNSIVPSIGRLTLKRSVMSKT